MTAQVVRDAEVNPLVDEVLTRSGGPPLAAIRSALLDAWPAKRQTPELQAALDLALNFRTWQSLTRSSRLSPAAAADSNVMCLSCHRAHASAFDHMLRYDYGNEFMTVADATGASIYPAASTRPGQGRTEIERQKGYYDRLPTIFAPQQRVLCNKCHAKD